MSYVYPGGSNAYIPSFEATGNLIVNFARNPEKFPLNKYVGLKKVDKDTGYYAQINPDQAARVVNSNGEDFYWAPGNDEPRGFTNTAAHQFLPYTCRRYAYPFWLDSLVVQQAAWDIVAAHAGIMASEAMTQRTLRVLNVLTTTGNWSGSTNTATSLGGGQWSSASTSNLYIKKTILQVCQNIARATNGVVRPRDLNLVISPALASIMSETDEIHNYLKSSPFSMMVVKGESEINDWGLPGNLYGVNVVVEDTVQVTTKKGVTRTDQFALAQGNAIFLARPDGLVSPNGGPTFNTFSMFLYEEFTVETKDDTDNRRVKGRIVENVAEVLTAPASGYLVTSAA